MAQSTSKTVPAQATQGVVKDFVGKSLQQLIALGALFFVMIVFAFLAPNFLSYDNLVNNMLVASTVTGIMALGATFVIATAGIDLSVGTGMTLCAVAMGVMMGDGWMKLPIPIGIILGLCFGAFVGFINGFNVSILNIPPFIATLAMMMAANGLSLIITDTKPIYFNESPAYPKIAMGNIIPGVPNMVLIFLLCAVIASVLLNKTILGRYALSIGSNEEATRISGVNTKKWLILVYVAAGVFTAIAGLLYSSRISVQPAEGLGLELQAIAAVVIGGTSLAGGRATIFGTVIGALLIATLNNGLQLMQVAQQWQMVATGIVILIAVFSDNVRRARENKA